MKSQFDFDNTAFLEHLERKGFYRRAAQHGQLLPDTALPVVVAQRTYLDDLVKGLGNDQTELTDLIGKNNVVASLRPLGISVRHVRDGLRADRDPEADLYLSP